MFKRTTTLNKVLAMTKRKKIIQGGSSAGKTIAIMSILIDRALKQEGKIFDVVAQTYDHLRDGTIQDLKNILKLTNRWDDNLWNDTKKIYTFHTGTIIRFKSIDKIGKASGPRRDVLYINEANYISYKIYDALSIRTFEDIYIDFNPVQRFWVHTEVMSEPDSEFIKVNYMDNEAIPENNKKDLENKRLNKDKSEWHKNQWTVYGLGNVGTLEGVIFENWNTIKDIPIDAKLLGIGLDWGFSNDPSAAVAVYKWNGKILLDELIYSTGLHNTQISKIIKDNFPITTQIIADSSEPKSIAELQLIGHRITGAKKGPDSITYGISVMQQYDILITEKSKNIIDEFTRYSWKEDRYGEATIVPEDKNNHGIDAVRYLVVNKLKSPIASKGPRMKISRF